MLGELWNLVKAKFKKKLILYWALAVSPTPFSLYPNLFAWLLGLPIFFIASTCFMAIITPRILFTFKLWLFRDKEHKIPMSAEIKALTERIGCHLKEVRTREGLCNAFVRGRTLVLGTELLERLDFNQLQAVVAHEVGHIKEKHGWIRFLGAVLIIIPLYAWSKLHCPILFTVQLTAIVILAMTNIALLAYTVLVMIPLNWFTELRADEIAAKFAGKENIISALLTLSDAESIKEPSEDHPSIYDRIKRIRELKL